MAEKKNENITADKESNPFRRAELLKEQRAANNAARRKPMKKPSEEESAAETTQSPATETPKTAPEAGAKSETASAVETNEKPVVKENPVVPTTPIVPNAPAVTPGVQEVNTSGTEHVESSGTDYPGEYPQHNQQEPLAVNRNNGNTYFMEGVIPEYEEPRTERTMILLPASMKKRLKADAKSGKIKSANDLIIRLVDHYYREEDRRNAERRPKGY